MRRNPPNICYDRILPQDHEALRSIDRLALFTAKMWEPGDKLPVSFMGGTATQRNHVIDAASRISESAFIDFIFVTSGVGVIRIAFNPSLGAWSNIGRDASSVSRSQPTMNLGFDQPGTYTHELCHAIGAIHEHQSPFGNPIQWNKMQVYHDLGGPPNNWDAATIDHNMFEKYSQTQINGTAFDRKSIMLYAFPASWTIDGFHSDANAVLSDQDKLWLATKYPGRIVVPPPIPPITPPADSLTVSLSVPGYKPGAIQLQKL